MMPHAAPILCCCCENESIRKLPRTPDTLISEEVKTPIPNAVAAGHACSAIFVRTSVAGTNVLSIFRVPALCVQANSIQ